MTGPTRKQFLAARPVGGSYTFGGRQGRMSPTRQRAFDELMPRYELTMPLPAEIADGIRPIIVEIGCGRGDATAAMAPDDAGAIVIACEPNGAMLANLGLLLDEGAITNVRLWLGDAFDLLAALGTSSVHEIRIWFPDPWPKPRHAGKRLITAQRLALLVDALVIGGSLHLATDAAEYAAETLLAIDAESRLSGGVAPRPEARPITRFEARGLRDGRHATDFVAHRVGPAEPRGVQRGSSGGATGKVRSMSDSPPSPMDPGHPDPLVPVVPPVSPGPNPVDPPMPIPQTSAAGPRELDLI